MTNGRIYLITCLETGLNYFGSTKQSLKARISCHESNPSKRVKLVIQSGRYIIILLEEIYFLDIRDLRERERFYIKNIQCVNKNIPNNSQKESWDQWVLLNREKERLRSKKFRLENPDYHRLYREARKIN